MPKMTLEKLYRMALEETVKNKDCKYNTECFKWLRHPEGDLMMVQQRLARLHKAEDIADFILNEPWESSYYDAYEEKPITRTALVAMLNRYRRFLAPTFIEWYRNDIDFEHIIPKLDKKYGLILSC